MASFLQPFIPPWSHRVLGGERVHLRAPVLADWAAWARLRGESREFLTPWEPTWPADALTRAAFRRRLRRYCREAREEVGYAFFVLRNGDNRLLGGITLSSVRLGAARSCSVGYWIGKPHARQGYMTEAVGAICGFVFDVLVLHRIEAACVQGNAASERLLMKCGFQREGYARGYFQINGAWRDHLLFALLESDPRPG